MVSPTDDRIDYDDARGHDGLEGLDGCADRRARDGGGGIEAP